MTWQRTLAPAAAFFLTAALAAQVGQGIARRGVFTLPAGSEHVLGVGDVDGDGLPDFVHRSKVAPQIVALSFGRKQLTLPSKVEALCWSDWNGDGVGDLVVGLPEHTSSGKSVGAVQIYDGKTLRTSTGQAALLREWIGARVDMRFGTEVLVFDANDDKRADLLVVSKDRTEVLDGTNGKPLWSRQVANTWSLVGDVDRDGVVDLFRSGLSLWPREIVSGRAGARLRAIGGSPVGDVTGDGVSEFVVSDRSFFRGGSSILVSGRGFRMLGQWWNWGPSWIEFVRFDSKRFALIRDFRSVTLYDSRFRPVGSASSSAIDAVLPWVDLDEDGIDEMLVFHGDLTADAFAVRGYNFWADTLEVESSRGGTQNFTIRPADWSMQQGRLCVILGSASGRYPSTVFGGREIPLVFDTYTALLLSAPNSFLTPSVFVHTGSYNSFATLTIPVSKALQGLRLDHSYVLLKPSTARLEVVSNPVPLFIR